MIMINLNRSFIVYKINKKVNNKLHIDTMNSDYVVWYNDKVVRTDYEVNNILQWLNGFYNGLLALEE